MTDTLVTSRLRGPSRCPCAGPPNVRTCGWEERSGTFPDSVVALSVRLPAAALTPSRAAILPTVDAGKESWVRAMNVVRVNAEPGSPRSVSPTRASPFSSSSSLRSFSESRGPPPSPPPDSTSSGRVTDMSVPTPVSGSSTVRWARSSPADSAATATATPMPTPRPRAVSSVRPLRRRSSLRTYCAENTSLPPEVEGREHPGRR